MEQASSDDFVVVAPGSRVTAVIVHEAPPDKQEEMQAWQRDISRTIRNFPGYERTEIFPPEPGTAGKWLTLVHFTSHEAMQNWLNSSERAAYVNDFHQRFGLYCVPHVGRFDAWFTSGNAPIPAWKMALAVLAGIYPTIAAVRFLLGSQLNKLGLALGVLVTNIVAVVLMNWLVMPVLNRMLEPWLKPARPLGWPGTLTGAAGIVAFLAAAFTLFHWLAA